MESLLRRLFTDEGGQDVVEYALLTAAIGLAGVAMWGLISTSIGTTYSSWNSQLNTDALVVPPDPPGGGS